MARLNLAVSLTIMETMSYFSQRNIHLVTLSPFLKYPTVSIKPHGLNSTNDPNCNTWLNDQRALCYDCQSCKAGMLANLKNDCKKIATINIIFLIIVYSVGCYAFRNNRRDNSYPAWK
ncbi:hypothetical protein VPH35_132335 [Triticum aestivum]